MRISVWTIALLLLVAPVVLTLILGSLAFHGESDTLFYVSKIPTSHAIHMIDTNRQINTDVMRVLLINGYSIWSPDLQRVAFVSYWGSPGRNEEIYIADLYAQTTINLSNHPGNDRSPNWSPDGIRVAFVSERDGNSEIYIVDADGQNLRNLTNHPGPDSDPQWSPDGTMIAFTSQREGNHDIFVMNADGSNPRNLTQHPAREYDPVWSPDSRRIAFISSRDDGLEIYVVSVHTAAVEQVSDVRGTAVTFAWQSE